MDQGAYFTNKCVEVLLARPDDVGAYIISISKRKNEILLVDDVTAQIASLLKQTLGDDYKFLVHLDEHKKM